MSDITFKGSIPTEQQDNASSINYVPFYLTAFSKPIKSYSKQDGKVETSTFAIGDLNAGKITKFDTELLATKGSYVQDNFYKYIMATQANLSDYESATPAELSGAILTKFSILNEKKALQGDGINKGLIRVGDSTTTNYKQRTFTLPTTIATLLNEIGTALAFANVSSNGRKRMIAMGTFKTFLYTETSTGSGVLNIDIVQKRYPNLDIVNTDDIQGLPTMNGHLIYDPALGHLKITGNGAGLLKTIETATGKDYIYDNGSLGCYFDAENGAVLSTVA